MRVLVLPAVFALLSLLAGCTTAPPPAPVSPGAGATASPTAEALEHGPESTLRKGMTAAEVRRILGEPAEIKPMKAPSGKAETWVYHRIIRGPVQQVQVGTRSTPIASMLGNSAAAMPTTVDEPIFRQQAEVIEETLNLLMFDDLLVDQSRSFKKRMEYQ